MSANSKIEWCDHTFNPWEGCTKVSPGCVNCYAETRDERFAGGVHWGKGAPRQRTSEPYWKQPLRWDQQVICDFCQTAIYTKALQFHPNGAAVCRSCKDVSIFHRPRVFCASLGDWLDEEVPIEWLSDLLALIHKTPNLDWLLLTKRPELWVGRLNAARDHPDCDRAFQWIERWLMGAPPDNVWMGTSVEDQVRADERIPQLLEIPAKVRFLSMEPLLSDVAIDHWLYQTPRIHWVIVGGESGPKKRPMTPEWARSLRDQCKAAGVPFFMKQIDKVQAIPSDLFVREFPRP